MPLGRVRLHLAFPGQDRDVFSIRVGLVRVVPQTERAERSAQANHRLGVHVRPWENQDRVLDQGPVDRIVEPLKVRFVVRERDERTESRGQSRGVKFHDGMLRTETFRVTD